MEEYKISLGAEISQQGLSNVKDQIKTLESNPIKLTLDKNLSNEIKAIKEQIDSLGSSKSKNKNALAINTESVEKSLNDIAVTIKEVRDALGTIDNKSGMKSLLSSINQITASLGKASDETQTLVSSLNALSKKDFNFNFGFNMGKSASQLSSEQGDLKRNAISQLKQQAKALEDYFDQYYKVAQQGAGVAKLTQGTNVFRDYWELSPNIGNTKASLKQQVSTYKQYIDLMQQAAKIKGVDLSGVVSGFSKTTDDIVKETKSATNSVEQFSQALKGLFGGGIDSESLTQILNDLNEINTAIKTLASDTSLGGLTQSFDNLSNTLKEITRDISTFAQAVNSGVSGAVDGIKKISNSGNSSDSFVDKEVLNMMKELGVAGGKGSEAFREIKSAMLEYISVAERAGNETGEVVNELAMLERSNAMSKVRDTALNYGATQSKKKELKEQQKLYKDFYADIRKTNKNGTKIFIPADVQAELPKNITRSLGSAFITKDRAGSMELDSWLKDLSERFPYVVDRTKDLAGQLMDVFQKLEIAKGRFSDASVDSVFSDNEIRNAENVIENAADNIVNSQQRIQDTSSASADSTSQSQQKIRQEYEETLEKIKQIDAQIAQRKNKLKEETSIYDSLADDPSYSKEAIEAAKAPYIEAYESDVAPLKQQRAELLAIAEAYERQSQSAKETTGVIENLKSTLQSMKVDRSSIDAIIKDVEELGFTAKDASVAMKNGNFDITVNGVDSIGRAITEIRHLDSATGEITGISRKISQSLSETDNFVKQQKRSVTDLTNQINELNRKAIDPNTSKPIKDESHLSSLKDKYNEVVAAIKKMGDASSSTFDEERNAVKTLISEYKSLTREYKNAETVATSLRSKDVDTVKATYASKLDVLISKMKDAGVYSAGFEKGAENLRSVLSDSVDAKGLVSFLNGLDKLDAGYKRAAQSAKSFEQAQNYGKRASGLESEIKNIQRISPEINQFEAEINGAKVSVQSLLKDLSQVKTKADFNSVNADLKAFKKAAEASGIAIRETAQQAKSIKEIKIKLSDNGFSGFEQEVARAHLEAEKLEGSYVELEAALKKLDAAMVDVYSADQSGDVRKLISANEEYEVALKGVYSQLKLNQQAEKRAYDAEMLSQKKASLNSEMEIWLKENTRAAKDFGEEIRRLQSSLGSLDANGVKLAGQQFKNITKQAQAMGKTGLTVFDKLKSKVKEYAAYLSAAEIFMYVEQGLQDMFEQVKLIDSAMTELKKVTNETEATYSNFLSNAGNRAKEIGTTIDGLVKSTASFARLGYGFDDAQGLAEVANIYAVVGDEVEGVEGATTSLISTMAAFKSEMNGLSNTDFAMGLIDKMNEVGNNFAISSGGIGEALQRSASSMSVAGNTIDETIALIASANTVVQNPEKVGNAFKTISMRLRAAKTDLENAGESTDGMAESTASLRAEMLALTGVDLMESPTQFKSTFRFLEELAGKWEHLTDVQRASVIELAAGGGTLAGIYRNIYRRIYLIALVA